MNYLKYLELAGVNDYVLLHTTPVHKAYNILSKNVLRLSLSETNESESNLGVNKLYYLSTARTPASGYIADRTSGLRKVNEAVLFVFDKNKLSKMRGIVIKPTDYWGKSSASGRQMGSSKEAEERIFSDSPIISNIISAIKEIRIMVYEEPYTNDKLSKQLLILTKKLNIKTKLFTKNNFQGYLLGREQPEDRKLAFNIIKDVKSPHLVGAYQSDARRAKSIQKKNPSWGAISRYLNHLTEYVYKTKLEDLSKDARSSLYYHLRYENSFYEAYKADIHNMRAGSHLEKDRFDRLLKHTKSRSVKDFFNKLYNKWYELYNNQ